MPRSVADYILVIKGHRREKTCENSIEEDGFLPDGQVNLPGFLNVRNIIDVRNRIDYDHDQAGMSMAAGKGDSILFRVILWRR